MQKRVIFSVLMLLAASQHVPLPPRATLMAQEPTEQAVPNTASVKNENIVQLVIHPQGLPANPTSIRFLPTAHELKSGNAAVVLLRMPWEQNYFMQNYYSKASELLQLDLGDPRIDDEFVIHFRRFHLEMRRAAYIRDADWNYPIDGPLYSILLPDAQGMRRFAGDGMSLWVASKIAKGAFKEAENGILIQFAIARHVSRTPFFVCQLVGAAIADQGLNRIQDLINQPNSPNYYYALSMLPDLLGDLHAVLNYESQILRSSLPSLTNPEPPIGDEVWNQIAVEFLQFMSMQLNEGMDPLEAAKLRLRLVAMSKKELPELSSFTAANVEQMLPEETFLRWALALSDRYHSQRQAALSLPIPDALQKLLELDEQAEKFQEETKSPASPFNFVGHRIMFDMYRFQRRAKLLQVVEAIRDFASRNDGQLPTSLAQIEVHCPNDPMTGKPFVFESIGNGKVRLSVAKIAGVEDRINRIKMPTYEISIAGGK